LDVKVGDKVFLFDYSCSSDLEGNRCVLMPEGIGGNARADDEFIVVQTGLNVEFRQDEWEIGVFGRRFRDVELSRAKDDLHVLTQSQFLQSDPPKHGEPLPFDLWCDLTLGNND
jgi:hypothetical protein